MPPPRKVLAFNPHKGPRQRHLNGTKFDPCRHCEDSKVDPSFIAPMTSLCCRRCALQLHWKVEYGKFIPLERPRKCNQCAQKTVALAYHHICQKCAAEKALCAKCQKNPILLAAGRAAGAAGGDDSDVGSSNGAEEEDEDDDERSAQAGAAAGAEDAGKESSDKKKHHSAMDPKGFVDGSTCTDDPDLQRLAGLDVSRLQQIRRRERARDEAEFRSELRERERRTLLRKIAKGEIAPTAGLDDKEEDDDDEFMSDDD